MFAVTRLSAGEIETYGFPADKPELVLVGNIGSSYWPLFSQSTEYLDGAADPLDRWSRLHRCGAMGPRQR